MPVQRHMAIVTAAFMASALAAAPVAAKKIKIELDGYQENPSVSTGAGGRFEAKVDARKGQIDYELDYDGLEGAVLQAHLHVARARVNGGVSVFLCTNLGNGPAGTQPCPASPGGVSGTITAADVIGPATQGISAGDFAELVDAIEAGAVYVNVHSDLHPGGEIRGQVAKGRRAR